MLLGILLTLHIIICLALIGVVLIQRSEGGALGMGGGSNAFMSARGAGDLLTRITWILAGAFFVLSLTLTFISGRERGASSVVDRVKIDAIDPSKLNRQAAPVVDQAAPLEAPAPQVRNPLLGDAPAPAGSPPTAPASAPVQP